jgi:hypothetical protein
MASRRGGYKAVMLGMVIMTDKTPERMGRKFEDDYKSPILPPFDIY